jgi:hypothetical protein
VWKVAVSGGAPVGAPAMLDSPVAGPWGLAVDATNVYYTTYTGGRVKTVPIAGGGAATTLAMGLSEPLGIAVDDTQVYWVDVAGDVKSVPKAGGAAPRSIVDGTNTNGGLSIAVNASSIFFTDGASTGDVYSVPLAGGKPPLPIVSGQPVTFGIALDSANVYFTNYEGNGAGCAPACGSASSIPLGGGSPTVLATLLAYPTAVAVDATGVYFASSSGGRVWRATPP